jgi:hypothetical protein
LRRKKKGITNEIDENSSAENLQFLYWPRDLRQRNFFAIGFTGHTGFEEIDGECERDVRLS